MSITVTGWPLVVMSFTGSSSHEEALTWLEHLSELLNRKSAFVVVVETSLDSKLDHDSRKAQSLWFKTHREALGQYCKGLARVLRSSDEFDRVAGPSMQKAMPFPLFASLDRADAMAWANKCLQGD